jgi:hypothetical protein
VTVLPASSGPLGPRQAQVHRERVAAPLRCRSRYVAAPLRCRSATLPLRYVAARSLLLLDGPLLTFSGDLDGPHGRRFHPCLPGELMLAVGLEAPLTFLSCKALLP